MIYTAHKFADLQALEDALAAAKPLDLDVIGEGQTKGYFANAVWAEEAHAAWEQSRIPNQEAPRWWGGVPREVLPPTLDLSALLSAVDSHVEKAAQSMDYKSAAHCATYVTSTFAQWAAEAQAFIAWRDAVWLTVYGTDPKNAPKTVEETLALLPKFVRPQINP